jgi:1-acyl-sn-glycerol-3-phosphate acyltransferase
MDDGAQHVRGGQLGIGSRLFYGFFHWVVRASALVYFRAYARNSRNLPRTGAVIVSPMHRSNLDVPLLGATSPRRLRYLAKGSLFTSRFWGWVLTAVGGFPLDREVNADRGALKAALGILERGEALAVFPEGERKSGPWVQPMIDGAVWLSRRSGAPILPVGIGGSADAMPKGANVPRPSRIVFLYGDLIPAPSDSDGSRLSRRQLATFSDELRDTLQRLFDEAQVIAGTPNPPLEQRPPRP